MLCNESCKRTIEAYLQCDTTTFSLSTRNFRFIRPYIEIYRQPMKSRSRLKLSIRTSTSSLFCAIGATYKQLKPICIAIRPLFVTFDPNFPFHKPIHRNMAKTDEISVQTKIEHLDQVFSLFCAMGVAYARNKPICNKLRPSFFTFDRRYPFYKSDLEI